MSLILFECEVTEFDTLPIKINKTNSFSINQNCVVISFCDKDENVIAQSEISIEDAKKLAKLILL